MKRVLVTGATGFIGYHLIKVLVLQEVEVYAMCSSNSGNMARLAEFKEVKIIPCNLENMRTIPNIIRERDFDVIYHLAWSGAAGDLRADHDVQIDNIRWTVQLAEVARDLRCKKIVVTGTVCENQCTAILRKQTFSKSSYYLLAKKTSYEMLKMNCLQKGIDLVWCTFYHPIGRYNKKEQLIANTIWKLMFGEQPQFSSGKQLFDVISVNDLAWGLWLAGKKELKKNKYFIGSGKPRSLAEYLMEVRDIVCPEAELQFGKYADDNLPMEREWLDIEEFSIETGFKPQSSFENGVIETRDWIKESFI